MSQPNDPKPPAWATPEFKAWLRQVVRRCIEKQLRAEKTARG